jgi:hypothetical protein
MAITVFIGKILGPCFLIVGIGIMFNRKFYKKVMEDFCKNPALIFFGGLFTIFIGFIIVISHNVWIIGWPVIITIYGWGGIVKGIWLIVFPESILKFMKTYQENEVLLTARPIVIIVLGSILTVFSYFS